MQMVLTTLTKEKAEEIKKDVLEQKLAVCVLELDSNSMFLWKGKIQEEKEVLLVFKTKNELTKRLIKRLKQIHPYDIPFIGILNVKANEEYLAWVDEEINKN